jgi:hypothetical protein
MAQVIEVTSNLWSVSQLEATTRTGAGGAAGPREISHPRPRHAGPDIRPCTMTYRRLHSTQPWLGYHIAFALTVVTMLTTFLTLEILYDESEGHFQPETPSGCGQAWLSVRV